MAGDYEMGKRAVQGFQELAERCEAQFYLGTAYRLMGELALEIDPDQAGAHLERSITLAEEIKADNHLALAYAGMGRFHKQQGNTEHAREYLTKALEIFERLGTLIEPDRVKKELAELPN